MSVAALTVTAGATAWALLRGPDGSPGVNMALLLLAYVGLAAMVTAELRRRRLTRRLVLGVSAALLTLAVVVPPTQSSDVWAYAMYGRMAAHYQDSPYRHTAADYPGDPIAARVGLFWQDTSSVYGPLFTAISAGAMAAVGDSPLAARLFFQGLAALAVAAALLLVDRRTRDPMALAFLGVTPMTVISVVNGGHNDALVGLAVLVAVLLAVARRPAQTGAALAAAVGVKVLAAVPAAPVALWVGRRQGWRAAGVLTATAAGIVVVFTAAAGGLAVIDPLTNAQSRATGGSIWHGPRRWLVSAAIDAGTTGGAAGRNVGSLVTWAGVALAIGLTLLLCARRWRDPDPFLVVGAAGLAYMLVGAYVLPWYVAWTLPALAICWRWWGSWIAVTQAGLLQLATIPDPVDRGPLTTSTPVDRFQFDLYTVWIPLLEVAAVVTVIVLTIKWLRTGRSTEDEAPPEAEPEPPVPPAPAPARPSRTPKGSLP